MLRILNNEKKYLVTDRAEYYYFDPKENQVLYHIPAHYPQWYEESAEKYLLPLLRDSEDSLFIQNYAVYYILNRFLCNLDNRNKKQLLGKKFDKYLEVVKEIFEFVDVIILRIRICINIYQKIRRFYVCSFESNMELIM